MVRVIVNGVSFYTTGAQIRRGVGSDTMINNIVDLAYKRVKAEKILGLSTTMHAYDGKMNKQTYQVQINV
jgi:hypothetical protein